MAAWKLAPALAAGCSVVLKPSELTPLTAMELADVFVECKIPPGVVNIVTGLGSVAGQALSRHEGVDKVAFTGSVPTGSAIMSACAKDIRNITLELGGKSPIIVFDDIDIDKTVEWIMLGCFYNNGQVCSATSRLLVQESIAAKLMARLIEETKKVVVTNPNLKENKDKTGLIGPLISATQWDRVNSYIQGAVSEGAKLLTGGKRPAGLSKGYYMEPTILSVTPKMKIWREEVFGPVLAVMTFTDESQAISLANDTDHGLGAAVFSNNQQRCARISKRLRCGIVWVNCSQPTFTEAPWGGMKKSGIGRELGEWGLHNYLEVKQITSYTSQDPYGWYFNKSKL